MEGTVGCMNDDYSYSSLGTLLSDQNLFSSLKPFNPPRHVRRYDPNLQLARFKGHFKAGADACLEPELLNLWNKMDGRPASFGLALIYDEDSRSLSIRFPPSACASLWHGRVLQTLLNSPALQNQRLVDVGPDLRDIAQH
eukprot:m.95039 g.95039  ORF g.95039 m.95039 type:complete len:140 (-) comp13037_c1_seq1:201-620(-)